MALVDDSTTRQIRNRNPSISRAKQPKGTPLAERFPFRPSPSSPDRSKGFGQAHPDWAFSQGVCLARPSDEFSQDGCELNRRGDAGFGPCFHSPGFQSCKYRSVFFLDLDPKLSWFLVQPTPTKRYLSPQARATHRFPLFGVCSFGCGEFKKPVGTKMGCPIGKWTHGPKPAFW